MTGADESAIAIEAETETRAAGSDNHTHTAIDPVPVHRVHGAAAAVGFGRRDLANDRYRET
jgi:hypothetical protein